MLARLINPPEDLYRQILGRGRVAYDAHDPAVDFALELPNQRLEGIDLTTRESPEQVNGFLYCLLRSRKSRVTGYFGETRKDDAR
jgi:hypothetical protein